MSESQGKQFIDPPPGYDGTLRWMNWHGLYTKVGPGFGPKFPNMIRERMRTGKSCIILVTGEPGSGKTWLAMRLSEIFDPKFKILDIPAPPPDQDPTQVAFNRAHLLHLIGNDTPLKRGQCLIIDESQFTFSARRFAEEDQKAVVEVFSAVRNKGLIIFIVVLHQSMVDKVIRSHVVSFQIHVTGRGCGEVYQLYTPKWEDKLYHPGIGPIRVQIPGFETCESPDCLLCPGLRGKNGAVKCYDIKAKYERRKHEAVSIRIAAASENMKPTQKFSDDKILAIWHEHKDEWGWSSQGLPNIGDLQAVFFHNAEQTIGRNKCVYLKARLLSTYDDLKPPPKKTREKGG